MATMNSLPKRGEETVPKGSRNERERRRGRRERRTRDVGGGVSTLMYAAQQGDVNIVKKIIGVEIPALFQRDRTGKTALHYTSTSGSKFAAQAADLMVMAAPDLVDGRDEDGFTPLHLAVIAGNMQLVTFLLANGADVNAVDNEKHTVVHWAAVCGETAALRAVLAAGAYVSSPDVHGGYPLHYAAQMCGGDRDSNLGLQVLQTLLSHSNIEVSVTDVDKREPLLWAASAGSARAVLALVRAGANVEASDKDGLTALHCAASRGHTDCMDTLLTLCGASVDIIDTNGCTALHYAVTLGHADATALLLAHGADPNRQDRKGRSPAHCGCAKGQFETVKLIGTQGANLWLRNARGDFPLHDAAASGRRELVKWLLEMRPSQVNARNNDGRCPLHMAALNDNVDMCKVPNSQNIKRKHKHGNIKDAMNYFQETIDDASDYLMTSVSSNIVISSNILLDAGAQINPVLRTSKNVFMTPLDCALQKGYRSTAKYLQLNGGVPANRLSDPSNPQINSALNLQIRDDVKFYGDTSSESEQETASKTDKKFVRKKPSLKSDKKKPSMSGSEKEATGVKLSKQKSIDKSSVKSEERRKTPSRIDYSNEIIINGKTEVNVTQSGEILLNKESVQTQTSAKFNEKDRRPRSAKYGRLRDKSAQSSLNKEMMISISSQASISKKDHSTSTSDEILEVTAEETVSKLQANSEEKKVVIENEPLVQQLLQDQSSIMSYTSEDAEDAKKEILVEASVHPLPKSVTDAGAEQQDISLIHKTESELQQEIEDTQKNVETTTLDPSDETLVKTVDTTTQVLEIVTISNSNLISTESKPIEAELIDSKIEEKMEAEKLDNIEAQAKPQAIRIEDKKEVVAPFEIPQQHQNDGTDDLKPKLSTDKKPIDETTKAIEEKKVELKHETNEGKGTEKQTESKSEDKSSQEKCISDQVTKTTDKTSKNGKKPDIQTKDRKSPQKLQVQKNDLSDLSSFSDEEEFPETHKSFRVLNDKEIEEVDDSRRKKMRNKKNLSTEELRSRSMENKIKEKAKRSKIPTPLFKSSLSKSDRHLNQSYIETNLDTRVPSLPNIRDEKNLREPPRCDSNMSAPLLTSILSDKDRDSASDLEEPIRNATKSKRFIKRRSKTRDSRSAGSDYESSNLIDSGFEPSPRSTRVPKWKNISDRGVNMTSVTQNIQTNIRRYHLERKIFQQLLELKRHQIRAGQHNEAVLVKRAIDAYHKSCASTVGIGRYVSEDYTFKGFEKFLYEALRKLQKNGAYYISGLPETSINPLLCTKSTNRCMHAAHAYTGIPCAAYLPKMDHHTIPKIGFNNSVECKPGTGGFLPTINPKKAVTLELTHGNDKQVISLPTDKLDQNKRYYVTFTVKGHEASSDVDSLNNNNDGSAHRHSKSD